MRTINITLSPESRLLRSLLVSTVLLVALVWRMLKRGDGLFSAKVGLACGFIALSCLSVWGVQRFTGRRWSWLGVLAGVIGFSIAYVWATVAVLRLLRAA